MPVKFINMTEQEFLQKTLIHKNCPLEYCLDILDNRRIWFANPTTWQDPFESMFLTFQYKLSAGKLVNHPWNKRIYATCMTETSTCEAYWNVYSHQQIGMSLAIKRDVLLNELKRYCQISKTTIFIGKVEYQKTSNIVGNLKANSFINPYLTPAGIRTEEAKVRLLLLKRSAYGYENEIRFFIVKKKASELKGIHMGFSCQPTDLISTITIDPNVKEKVFGLIKSELINKYNFVDYSPNRKRVQQSLLYTPPKSKVFIL